MAEAKEYMGWWWLPENPERRIPGILKIEDKKNTLELLDTIDGVRNDDFWGDKQFEKYLSIPIIFGVVDRYVPITLLDCSINSLSEFHKGHFAYPIEWGFSKCKFSAHTILLHKHSKHTKDPLLKSIALNFTNLDVWANITPNRVKRTEQSIELNTTPTPPIFIPINDDITIKIGFSLMPLIGLADKKRGVEEHTFIEILSKDGIKFNDALNNFVLHLQNFFTLASAHVVNITYFKGYLFNEDANFYEDSSVEIHTIQGYKPEKTRRLLPGNMLFSLQEIKDEIPEVLKNFILNGSKYAGAYNLYFAVINKPDLYLEMEFLSYIQAIEGMYSYFYKDDKFLKDSDFKKVKKELYEAIPDTLPTHLIERLKSTIKDANKYSLKEKIEKILSEYPDEFLDKILGENDKREEFIKTVVKIRNAYSHGNDRQFINYVDLPEHSARLKFILEMCLLQMMGFNVDKRSKIMNGAKREFRVLK